MQGPQPAQNQRARSSGKGKGCLIAFLIVGFVGCVGTMGLGFLAWLANASQRAHGHETFNSNYDTHPSHQHPSEPSDDADPSYQHPSEASDEDDGQ